MRVKIGVVFSKSDQQGYDVFFTVNDFEHWLELFFHHGLVEFPRRQRFEKYGLVAQHCALEIFFQPVRKILTVQA
ncbi:hypothetical protein D3C73_1341760 [compost metagenome]